MNVNYACLMEVGDRPNQEDALRIGKEVYQEEHLYKRGTLKTPALFAVCDGMGGHAYGEVASLWTARQLEKINFEKDKLRIAKQLAEIQKASEKEVPGFSGTTLALCLVEESAVICANAGDSGIFGIGSEIRRLFREHSVAWEFVETGQISPEEAKRHPYRHMLTFGVGPAFEEEWEKREPFVVKVPKDEFKYILICSDGLTDNVDEEEIKRCVLEKGMDSLKELYLMARERTHYLDNTSLILIEL